MLNQSGENPMKLQESVQRMAQLSAQGYQSTWRMANWLYIVKPVATVERGYKAADFQQMVQFIQFPAVNSPEIGSNGHAGYWEVTVQQIQPEPEYIRGAVLNYAQENFPANAPEYQAYANSVDVATFNTWAEGAFNRHNIHIAPLLLTQAPVAVAAPVVTPAVKAPVPVVAPAVEPVIEATEPSVEDQLAALSVEVFGEAGEDAGLEVAEAPASTSTAPAEEAPSKADPVPTKSAKRGGVAGKVLDYMGANRTKDHTAESIHAAIGGALTSIKTMLSTLTGTRQVIQLPGDVPRTYKYRAVETLPMYDGEDATQRLAEAMAEGKSVVFRTASGLVEYVAWGN